MLLRPAEPDDAIAVARVHVRSWQVAYRTLLPDDYLNQLNPEDRAIRYDFASLDPLKPQTIVAVEEGAIVGFATTAPSRELDLPNHGELYALYVNPEQWGRGVGVALVSAARRRLFGLGFRDAVLWVLAGNAHAERFYQIDKWTPDGLHRADSVWGITVNEIRYQRVARSCASKLQDQSGCIHRTNSTYWSILVKINDPIMSATKAFPSKNIYAGSIQPETSQKTKL